MSVFRCVGNDASNRVLNVGPLKCVYLCLRKVKAQIVAVVKFGMYNRRGDGTGCFKVKVGMNAAVDECGSSRIIFDQRN